MLNGIEWKYKKKSKGQMSEIDTKNWQRSSNGNNGGSRERIGQSLFLSSPFFIAFHWCCQKIVTKICPLSFNIWPVKGHPSRKILHIFYQQLVAWTYKKYSWQVMKETFCYILRIYFLTLWSSNLKTTPTVKPPQPVKPTNPLKQLKPPQPSPNNPNLVNRYPFCATSVQVPFYL